MSGGGGRSPWEDVRDRVATVVDDVGVKINDAAINAGDWAQTRANDIAKDPTRASLAVLTTGGSELFRTGGEEAAAQIQIDAERNAPKMDAPPEPPKTPTPAAPAAPTDNGTTDVAKEKRVARGRASTILTGSRGLGSSASTSRRTLLGV